MSVEIAALIIAGLSLVWSMFAHLDGKKNADAFTFVKKKKTARSSRTFRTDHPAFLKNTTHEIIL